MRRAFPVYLWRNARRDGDQEADGQANGDCLQRWDDFDTLQGGRGSSPADLIDWAQSIAAPTHAHADMAGCKRTANPHCRTHDGAGGGGHGGGLRVQTVHRREQRFDERQ